VSKFKPDFNVQVT